MDVDTNKKLSDKISEKQDIVNQLREDEKRGTLINNTSESCGGMDDTQQGLYESNDEDHLKSFGVQEEEMLYHSVVELFPDGIFVLDLKGFIQSCNATAVTLLGYSKKELIGRKFSEMGKYDEKGIATYLNNFDSIIQGKIINPFDLKLQKKDGTLFTAEIRTRLLIQNGKKFGIQVITRKIRDIKIQDRKIKESKDSLQRILSHIPDMISVHDPEMNIIYSNWKGFANIPEDKRILKTKCYKTYRGLDHICPDCKAGIVLNTKESIQVELELPEGVWVDLRVLPLVDENNDVELFVEWVRDITNRKETEKSLLESESRFRDLVNNTPDFIYSLNRERRHTAVNRSVCNALGIEEDEIIGKNHLELGFAKDICDEWHKLHDKVFSTKQVVKAETSTLMPDGTEHIYEVVLTPIFDENENVTGIRGISRDITEKKKAKQKIIELKDFYEQILENVHDGIWVTDKHDKMIFFNPGMENISGVDAEKVLGLNIYHDFPVETTEYFIDHYERAKQTRKPQQYEARVVTPIGRTTFQTGWLIPRFDNDMNYQGMICTAVDNTERKRFQDKLIESKKRLDLALEGGDLGTWDWNIQTDEVHFNCRWAEMFGYQINELKPHISTWENLVHPDDLPRVRQVLNDHIHGKTPFYEARFRMKHKSGDYIWILDKGKVIELDEQGNPVRACGTHLDITHQKQIELALEESEQKYRLIFEMSPIGITTADKKGKIVDINQSGADITGHSRDELIGKKYNEINFIDRKVLFKIVKNFSKTVKGEPLDPIEMDVVDLDGKTHIVEVRILPIRENGKFSGTQVMMQDITERKKAEETLRKSEEKLSVIFNSSNDAFCIQSIPDLKIIEVNDEACKRFGYSREEFKTLSVDDITATPTFSIDSEEIQQKLKKVFDGETQSFEWLSKAKNGEEIWHLMTLKTIDIDGEKRLLVQAKDISDLKKVHDDLKSLNEQLESEVEDRTEEIHRLLQQKDEFINQLGHDLKNPLGPFLQLIPILENHVADEKDKRMLNVLNRNANYMRNLVKKTIDLAKLNSSKTRFSFENVSLGDLVDEVIAVNSSLFDKHDVVVENNVSSDCLVYVDSLHVQEVFTNLFNNAVKYSKDERWIGIKAVEKNDWILVSFCDKGVGISEEQLPFLFDEYYKADSSRHDFDSSGLGLPICKRIVEKHGGQIWAESKGLGKGSTFYFTLPKKDNQA